MRRSLSEGDLFHKSWDYTFGVTRLTLIEELLELPDISSYTIHQNGRRLLTKATTKKQSTPRGDSKHKLILERQRENHNSLEINYHKGKDGRSIMEAASMNQIVAKFSQESQDMLTIHHLIVAHEHFVPSTDLFNKFIWFYKNADKNNDSKTTQVIRFRIINIIKKWIELNYNSFLDNDKLGLSLLQFKRECLQNKNLLSHIEKAIHTHKEIPTYDIGPAISWFDIDSGKKGKPIRLKDYSPSEFAQQLTILDHIFFQRIKISELLNTRWISKIEEAPNIIAAGKRLNTLSYWFAFQIVAQETIKKRIVIVQYLLRVAQCLIEYRSFESLMAIFLAFNLSCITRLTELWKSLSVKYVQEIKQLEHLMSPQNNFKGYREIWQKTNPPAVPCQEVYLRDILFHTEGTENFVKDKILDCLKLDILGEIIEKIRVYKTVLYNFKVNKELIEGLLGLETINMDTLTTAASNYSEPIKVPLTGQQIRKKSSPASTKLKRTRSTSLNNSAELLSPRSTFSYLFA